MSENIVTFALKDFQFPTLILWRQNDTWVKQADIGRRRDEIPSAEFHAIPKAGHMLVGEQPELFNSMGLTFLRSHGQ